MQVAIHTMLLVQAARQQGQMTAHVDGDALRMGKFTMCFIKYVVGKALDTVTLRVRQDMLGKGTLLKRMAGPQTASEGPTGLLIAGLFLYAKTHGGRLLWLYWLGHLVPDPRIIQRAPGAHQRAPRG